MTRNRDQFDDDFLRIGSNSIGNDMFDPFDGGQVAEDFPLIGQDDQSFDPSGVLAALGNPARQQLNIGRGEQRYPKTSQSIMRNQPRSAPKGAGNNIGRVKAGRSTSPAVQALIDAPLQTPILRASSPDEVRVPLLDGGDGKTDAQRKLDQLVAEVRQLLGQGATERQLNDYIARTNHERNSAVAPFSRWENARAALRARGAGRRYAVSSRKIQYQRSDPRGSDKRRESSVLEAAGKGVMQAVNPLSALPELLEAGGGFAETLGVKDGKDKAAAIGRGWNDATRLGFNDELSALSDTVLEGDFNDFGQRYDQHLGEQRATDAYDEEHNFGYRLGGQIAGALVMPTKVPMVGNSAFLARVPSAFRAARAAGVADGGARAMAVLAGRRAAISALARQAGGEAAAVGAAYGTGSGEGGLGNRLVGAVTGGTLAGLSAYGVGQIAPRLVNAYGSRALVEGRGPQKYVRQGSSPRRARYLAQPYDGRGHHFFPQGGIKLARIAKLMNVKIPKDIGNKKIKLPEIFVESRFNVLKPRNMERGRFYEEHFRVDPSSYGNRLPKRFGKGWSGKALGLQKYGLLGRLWHGSPTPFKAAVGGTAGAAGGIGSLPYWYLDDEE